MRRLSTGDIGGAATADVVASAAVAGVSVLAEVVSAAGEVTGFSSCGAADDREEGSSSVGTAGDASVEIGVAASFLPKILPKIEFLCFDLDATSRGVEAGVVSAMVDSAPATGATSAAPTPVPASPAGMTGSPITRDAVRC